MADHQADGGFDTSDDGGGIRRPAGQVWRGRLGVATSQTCVVGAACAQPVREVRCNFTTEDGVPNAVSPAARSVPVGRPLHTMRWR